MIDFKDANLTWLVGYYNALINIKERHKYESNLSETYIKYASKIDESIEIAEKRILEYFYGQNRNI